MVKSKSLYHLALAGVLCAIGIIIPIFSPVKIRLDPMSFTLASHVAIFLAMFISPAVGVAVSVGTTLGFLVGGFTMPVVLRALTHVVWGALGAYYLQKHPELIDFRQQVANRSVKLFGLGTVLSLIHAALETMVCVPVYFGQGLSGAINGSAYGANNTRLTPADQMLAKVTRIAGVVFFVVAILACVFASRLA